MSAEEVGYVRVQRVVHLRKINPKRATQGPEGAHSATTTHMSLSFAVSVTVSVFQFQCSLKKLHLTKNKSPGTNIIVIVL